MDFAKSILSYLSPVKPSDLHRPPARGGAPVGPGYIDSSDDESPNQGPSIFALSRPRQSSPGFPPPKRDPSWWKEAEGMGTRTTRSNPNGGLDLFEAQQILDVRWDGKKQQFLVRWRRPDKDEQPTWVNDNDARISKAMKESFLQEQTKRAFQASRELAEAKGLSKFTHPRGPRRTDANDSRKPVVVQEQDVYDFSSHDEADNSFKNEKGLGTRRQVAKENLNTSLANFNEVRRKKLKKEQKKSQNNKASFVTSTPIQIDGGSSDDDIVMEKTEKQGKYRSSSLDTPFKKMKMSSSPSSSNSNEQPKSDPKFAVPEKKAPVPAPRRGKNRAPGFQSSLDPYLSNISGSSMLSRKAQHVLDHSKDFSRPSDKASSAQTQTYDLTGDNDEEDPFKVNGNETDFTLNLFDPVVGSMEEVNTENLSDSVQEVSVVQESAVDGEEKPEQKNYAVVIMDENSRPPGFDEGQQEVDTVYGFGTDLHPAGSIFFVQYKGEDNPRLLTKKVLFEWQPDHIERVEAYLKGLREANPNLRMAKDEHEKSADEKKAEEGGEEESEEWEEVSPESSGKKEKNKSVLEQSVLA